LPDKWQHLMDFFFEAMGKAKDDAAAPAEV